MGGWAVRNAYILGIGIMFLSIAGGATPTPNPTDPPNVDVLWITDISGTTGDLIYTDIWISNPETAVDAFGLDLHFDAEMLQFQSCSRGALTDEWQFFDCNVNAPGVLRCAGFEITNSIPSGSYGTIISIGFIVTCSGCSGGEESLLSFSGLVDDLEGWITVSGTFTYQTDPTGTPTELPSATFTTTPIPTISPTPSPTVIPTETSTPYPSLTPTPSSTPVPTGTATPTWTEQPSETPSPTASPTPMLPTSTIPPTQSPQPHTPTPTFTAILPSPTMTPSAIPTFSPSPIPTFSPTVLPTSTQTPNCGELGCQIDIPATMFHPGDVYYLSVEVCNPGQETFYEVPLFVILDVYGAYFFAPGFSTFDYYVISVLPGVIRVDVIPPFVWPDNVGSGSGVRWYAGMTDTEITSLFGDMDVVVFGWE